MKFFSRTAHHTRMDKKRNADIYRELDVVPHWIILKIIDIIGQFNYIVLIDTEFQEMKKKGRWDNICQDEKENSKAYFIITFKYHVFAPMGRCQN